ncbi:hypothetical protein E3P86_02294 [Wallemia ichthyophaga]|uniref:Pre-mRNA-splicing factor CLF1 n=1 Tax=Wallemia ichthyophaga TaxID=245174 RepID=A0A4T0J6R7_WALIC|nr:hypothetical protein E3P86_02294 [Wallemia ichthyophaga]
MQEERAPRVKNRLPANVQITAEQLLREANERQDPQLQPSRQRLQDFEELNEFQGRKRREFEERIRMLRIDLKTWATYAKWEATQGEYDRARSVWERALDVEPVAHQLWLQYIDMELKARNINHARNLFDRVVTLLPRINQFWYKYVHMEELIGNVAGARQVFERWMSWQPDDKAWSAYIKLEERYQEWERVSGLYERLIGIRPEPKLWVKWARYEEDRGKFDRARELFQMALEFFGDSEEQIEKAQSVFNAFAKMETRAKEFDRARVIYKYALSRLPQSKSADLFGAYTRFEKQYGSRSGVEATVLGKRRLQYEAEVTAEPSNYDTWFEYLKLEEYSYRMEEDATKEDALARTRELYERAVSQVPPSNEKRHWRRYIFIWLSYAIFEEADVKDFDRARVVYQTAIALVPHKQFTFAKLWNQYARFEIRRLNLIGARKIFGQAIGMCPKERLFKAYIDLEFELREFDRIRALYEKYLEFDYSNCSAWIRFAQLEAELGDTGRARSIFELAVGQDALDMPELLWKAYIDFETEAIEEGESSRNTVRSLYDRLLDRTSHVKVWIAYAHFEKNEIDNEQGEDDEPRDEKARRVYERGYNSLKERGLKEERVVLLESWKEFESENGDNTTVEKVQSKMPRVVKKWRNTDDGVEEYFDMLFADDETQSNPASLKFLEMAHAWKTQKQHNGNEEAE